MPDFDAAADFERAFAIGTGVAGDDVADIRQPARLGQIATPVDAGVVVAVVVGASTKSLAVAAERSTVAASPAGCFTFSGPSEPNPAPNTARHVGLGRGL